MTTRDDEVPVRTCPVCGADVPAAAFCGDCGADAHAPVDPWRILLRPNVYAAAHREPIWMPRISSSYLPRLAGRMRRPYRVGLIILLITLVAFAGARATGPLGVTCAIGWPLLFGIYLWQTAVFRDLPLRIPLVAAVLGVGSGVAWWLVAGRWLAEYYGVSTGSALMLVEVLSVGLLLTAGGAALMLVPAMVTRFIPVRDRESLDGFVVGAVGALGYLMASIVTIVGPQIVEGLVDEQSFEQLLEDAITYGVVSPVVATAAGGLVGLRLWFTPNRQPGRDARRARRALTLCTVLGIPLYLAVWTVDATRLPPWPELAIKLVLAVLALLVVRCAVQIALLHETPDPATGEPILCEHCERVVPDLAFCAACGAAARASSRTSRRRRRESPPVRELA